MKKYMIIMLLAAMALYIQAGTLSHVVTGKIVDHESGERLVGVYVLEKGTQNGTITDAKGHYQLTVKNANATLVVSLIGYGTQEWKLGGRQKLDVKLRPEVYELEELVIVSEPHQIKKMNVTGAISSVKTLNSSSYNMPNQAYPLYLEQDRVQQDFNTEGYDYINENTFLDPVKNPLSTFSIDVDVASYANVRRFINQGQRPPADAVRVEELINYFSYDYPDPQGEHPFEIITEYADCPWNKEHKLLHIGLQGKKIDKRELPASNLVFLIDVSGSMYPPNRLPLLKSAFKMLIDELRPQDKVAIVVYAGAAGLVLPPTSGSEKATIHQALENLEAGGSTAGGAGIKLAYKVAEENFIKNGNNRIILASDGDFNVGASSNSEMERLIEVEREKGVYLTILGFGMGNYKDDKMERLSNKGNGNYAYIDNIQEARKVFVTEFGGTLFTIAKDVKLQIEMNPAHIQSYRLIGYENRLMPDEDFNDDKKDAGDLGAGHTVTALYEIVPVGAKTATVTGTVDKLKYQNRTVNKVDDDLLTLKLRYKKPDGKKSMLLEKTLDPKSISLHQSSGDFKFSAAVALYGMLLRESKYLGEDSSLQDVVDLATAARGKDAEGYRAEFIRMVKSTPYLSQRE
ncbi:MAG: von Willebrand factor type A domain-containing protein [Cyclobacteriaceae bacterium]